ncbi:MAG: WD40/YVTN/BNR-like repeat-containing protein [Jatrophihabitans sp.]
MTLRPGPRRLLSVLSATVLGVATLIAFTPAAQAKPSHAQLPSWTLLDSGSTSHFRGLAAVSRQVAWISGYDGTVLRTVDGGRHWIDASPAGASTLQFRDISASDAWHAVAMAAGPGTDSRLYATSDGGRHWTLAYQNADPAAFFDCMSFYDARHGLVVSDPVDGRFRILATGDGGRSWSVLPAAGMPAALTGEAGFAASGEGLTTAGHDAWFGSGGGATARIFHSADGGRHWDVRSTPLTSSPSAGVFGLAFRTPLLGVAVGGDFAAPAAATHVSALSYLHSPWFSPRTEPHGYRSGVSWLPFTPAGVVSVGLTGSDVSYDAGLHWQSFDTGQFDTVSCTRDGACWASGDLGRVAVLHR